MQRNVLFIMVDCMRADIISDRRRYPSLPTLDGLLQRSSSFGATIAAAPLVAWLVVGVVRILKPPGADTPAHEEGRPDGEA